MVQIRTQAAVNTRTQFVEYLLAKPEVRMKLVKRLGELVHENLAIERAEESLPAG